jgi:adenylate cyclase
MASAWLSFVPGYIADDVRKRPSESPVGREWRFEAVTLFADISGFTPMSEALAQLGRAGAEELTTILNGYFSLMIHLAHLAGGVVGKFGGDAMVVLFRYNEHDQRIVAQRAIQCALDMQSAMASYNTIPTGVGTFSLAMKIGMATGPVFCTTLGDPAIHLEYLVAGAAIDCCASAEHHATAGEIAAHNSLLTLLDRSHSVARGAQFGSITRQWRPAPLEPVLQAEMPAEISKAAVDMLARYLHPTIAQRLRAGQLGFINEHRTISVLFVGFDEFAYDNPQVGADLQAYFSTVVRIVQRYDGYLNRIDTGDKGSRYIVVFGAPVSHENDEERAVSCALELQHSSRLPIRIGMNTGSAYCGLVGSATRQEYTVMGDAVNLAARLMQAAQAGQVLVGPETWRRTAADFIWQPLAPLTVKGKTSPITAYMLRGVSLTPSLQLQEPAHQLPLIGRSHELQAAQKQLELALQGHGQVIGVHGEAGIGKSRLAAEITRLAAEHGFVCYSGACQSYGTSSSYLVWRAIWQQFFGVDSAWAPAAQALHIQAELGALDLRLVVRLPLLDAVFNLDIPDNDITRALEPQMRADLLRSLLLECLRRRAGKAQLFLLLEDCHWIDPLSRELLETIGRSMADIPLVLLVLYRQGDEGHSPIDWAAQVAYARQIQLFELAPAEVTQFTMTKLEQVFGSQSEIPTRIIEQLNAKAQGNPFYLEELVNLLRDRGLDLHTAQAQDAIELPDTLHRLILSRIDRLSESEQMTLKIASVIGRRFKASWLWNYYPAIGKPDMVLRSLKRLSELNLTPMDTTVSEPEYQFKHILTQEVTYESLAFATRTTLHERVGQYIEQAYADATAHYLDMLAYHYGRSRNTAKQRIYFRQAGDAAKAGYANQAAIDYYERLMPLLQPQEQGQVMYELGDIWQLTGDWGKAESIYRQVLSHPQAADNPASQAWCQLGLGTLLSQTQASQEALALLEAAQAAFEQLEDQQGLSRTLQQLSMAHSHHGNYTSALSYAERQRRLASQAGDQRGLGIALGNIGAVHIRQGDLTRALEYFEQQLDIVTSAGFQQSAIFASSDLAGLYWQQGDVHRALEYLQRALVAASAIGYYQAIGFLIGNAGELYRERGAYERALDCYRRGLQIATDLGDWLTILPIVINIATVYTSQGRYQEAESLYRRVVELASTTQDPYWFCENLYQLAELRARQQYYDEAQSLNEQALLTVAQVERRDITVQAQLLSIRLAAALHQIDVQTAVGRLATLTEEWQEPQEQADALYCIWQIDNTQEQARRAAAELYLRLYEHVPSAKHRQRYAELTGLALPEPPPLPPLPEHIVETDMSLAALLARIDAG